MSRGQNKRRKVRALLGLCSDCLEPCVNGLTRCQRHADMHRETDRRRLERQKVAQGFRYVRVPIGEN